jgi:pimeloyl-ACP methyl ester carboxylesterase
MPVLFPEPEKTNFGLLSEPTGVEQRTTGVVLMSGTFGGTTTLGRNRMWLKMARSLADRGYPVLRFDYTGLGDSIGDQYCYELETPAVPEAKAAFDLLESRGVTSVLIVATCYGSRGALAGAAGDPRVRGLYLLVPPIRSGTKGVGGADHLAEYAGTGELAKRALSRRVIRKLIKNPQARKAAARVVTRKLGISRDKVPTPEQPTSVATVRDADEGFHRPLRALLTDGIPVRFLYGEEDFFWTEFREAREGRLGRALERFPHLVDIETVPGVVRGFLSVRVQDIVINSSVDWVGRLSS